MTETAICRECKNYVPVDSAVAGSLRPDGTCVCRECRRDDLF